MSLVIAEYLSWVGLDLLQVENIKDTDSQRVNNYMQLPTDFQKDSRLTWLDSLILCFIDLLSPTVIEEESLAYLDLFDNQAYPSMNSKNLPG